MREIIRKAWEMYLQFCGPGMHLGMYFAAVLFLGMFSKTKREKESSYLLSLYSLFFWGIFFFPVTAKIIMDYCIGAEVYWRMFWILPFPLIIAYAFTLGLKQIDVKWKRNCFAVCMAAAVILTGRLVDPLNFSKVDNPYKLPQSAVDVCQMIHEDAQKNGISEKKTIAVNDLVSYIRQYDATIQMPYGRDGIKEGRFSNKNTRKIFEYINNPAIDFQGLLKYAKKENCNYLVYYRTDAADAALENLGYEKIGENEQYGVYRWGDGSF
ncbi:MAG: hypothetical protein HFH41_09545 [Lachnospiraceae bacterium]|nr:hypothetical protein [Lachnospiraceae bacterium]